MDQPGPFDDLLNEPLAPTVVDGAVVIIGPGSVALAMTADAAEITAIRLLDAAQQARLKF